MGIGGSQRAHSRLKMGPFRFAEKIFVTSNNVPGFHGIQTLPMKLLPSFLFVSACVASLAFPVRFEMACLMVVATGLATIVAQDYARNRRVLPIRADVAVTLSRKERFGLAA